MSVNCENEFIKNNWLRVLKPLKNITGGTVKPQVKGYITADEFLNKYQEDWRIFKNKFKDKSIELETGKYLIKIVNKVILENKSSCLTNCISKMKSFLIRSNSTKMIILFQNLSDILLKYLKSKFFLKFKSKSLSKIKNFFQQ